MNASHLESQHRMQCHRKLLQRSTLVLSTGTWIQQYHQSPAMMGLSPWHLGKQPVTQTQDEWWIHICIPDIQDDGELSCTSRTLHKQHACYFFPIWLHLEGLWKDRTSIFPHFDPVIRLARIACHFCVLDCSLVSDSTCNLWAVETFKADLASSHNC